MTLLIICTLTKQGGFAATCMRVARIAVEQTKYPTIPIGTEDRCADNLTLQSLINTTFVPGACPTTVVRFRSGSPFPAVPSSSLLMVRPFTATRRLVDRVARANVDDAYHDCVSSAPGPQNSGVLTRLFLSSCGSLTCTVQGSCDRHYLGGPKLTNLGYPVDHSGEKLWNWKLHFFRSRGGALHRKCGPNPFVLI